MVAKTQFIFKKNNLLKNVIRNTSLIKKIPTSIQLGFPFAKLLRNFCGTKRTLFLSLRINNNLRNHTQKSFRVKLPFFAFAKLKFCAIPQLEFCAIPQFRKTQAVGDGVCFLEFNSGRILFWNVFLLVTFT